MGDFLAFRRMITPLIIQLFFWLGVVACVVGGIVLLSINAEKYNMGQGQAKGTGLLLLLAGPLVLRIYSEILILLFRMNETLTSIKNNTGHRTG